MRGCWSGCSPSLRPPHPAQLGDWLRAQNLLPSLQLPSFSLPSLQLPSLSTLFSANPVLDAIGNAFQAQGQLLNNLEGDNIAEAAQEVAAAFAGLFDKQ